MNKLNFQKLKTNKLSPVMKYLGDNKPVILGIHYEASKFVTLS